MEVYVLDSLLRRTQVIDRFESLIWTERFNSFGDFEIDISVNRESLEAFAVGNLLAMNESYRVMIVETVENKTDQDGKQLLKVKGRSLEVILFDRVAMDVLTDTTTHPTWNLANTPGNIARKIFRDICITGVLDPADVIPFIQSGTIFPEDTITESPIWIELALAPTTVYDAIKALCDPYDLGFRLVRNFDTSQLYFDIYAGNDRSTFQSILPPVIFSPQLESLQNTSELTTVQDAKNVAYVFSPAGFQMVYDLNVDPEIAGFERHILMVDASDITSDVADVPAALIRRGTEELAKQRPFSGFDGELNQYSNSKYGVDYQLGDILELRNSDGAVSYVRVTEQILVSDAQGDRAYPTLVVNETLYPYPGSWFSQTSKKWEDFTTEYWSDMT